jgi:transcriptional regulator with XRE-family HTH domain
MTVQHTAHMQAVFPFAPYTPAMSQAAGSRLRSLREAAGISLRELARQIGEQPTNLSYWERTGSLPRADLVIPIAQVLGVTPEEILGQDKPRRGAAPGGKVRLVFEQVQKLPRRRQDKIVEVVAALLKAG